MDKLSIFFDRLSNFLGKAVDAPASMWAQAANEPGYRTLLLVSLVAFAGGALYLIVSFLKASWKQKLHMLCYALLIVFVLLVIFWFALGM